MKMGALVQTAVNKFHKGTKIKSFSLLFTVSPSQILPPPVLVFLICYLMSGSPGPRATGRLSADLTGSLGGSLLGSRHARGTAAARFPSLARPAMSPSHRPVALTHRNGRTSKVLQSSCQDVVGI